MIALLLTFVTLLQALPVSQEGGTVTGILRTTNGGPASGIRVAAMPLTGNSADVGTAALVSLAQTDENGRFVLQNIPPGRYRIMAGRVDQPTFYPGTVEIDSGTILAVASGAAISGIDFTIMDSSIRPPATEASTPRTMQLNIPVLVLVEGGGRLPVSAGGRATTVQLIHSAMGKGPAVPLTSAGITLPITQGITDEYRVRVENLPDNYVVKSMTFNSTDLITDTLKVSATLVSVSQPVRIITFGGPGALQDVVDRATQRLAAATNRLFITLDVVPQSRLSNGALVSGRVNGGAIRSVYISGMPGVLYSDGTFEFRGVPPGRHIIATLDNPPSSRPFGVSVVVGNQDVSGVELVDVPLLPLDLRSLNTSMPAGEHPPGTILALPSLRGQLLDRSKPSRIEGSVVIVGDASAEYPVDAGGRFEIPRLLPGSYELEIQAAGYDRIKRTIVVANEDLNLDLNLTAR